MTKKITRYFVTDFRELATLDFPVLEEAAGVQFNETQQQRILELINSYLQNLLVSTQAPAADPVKKHLEKTSRQARNLAKLLFSPSHEAQAALALCWPFDKETHPVKMRVLLEQLAEKADAAARDISPSRGHPGNPASGPFIRELHEIWRQAGGTGLGSYYDTNTDSYSGLFLLFLQLILKQGGYARRRAALHKAIKAALKA